MGTKRGGKAVLIQGKKKYAFPREVSGKTRWFVDKDIDVTENLDALGNLRLERLRRLGTKGGPPGRRQGGRVVVFEGRKRYAFSREVDGHIRWFVSNGTDVTASIAPENDSNAVMVLAKRGRPPKGEQDRGETPLAPVAAPSLEALTQALRRMDAQVQNARDVLKDVEVHLRAIKQQLNGADYLRELAIAEERERAKKRAPKGHEKMTNRDGRMQGE